MLFAEASSTQMIKIMGCLQRFCEASGQIVNTRKTHIYFSKNVDTATRRDIAACSGFMETAEIGRYLGAYILEGRNKRRAHAQRLDKIKNKLKGWKQKCLSMAGRVVLAQSSITPVAYYQMQHGRISKAVCHQIEQAQRAFVWGLDEQHRRAHLINWRTLCLPKEIGGLGFKSLERMNTAFLLKVCWELINHSNALWVRALNSKYGISNSTPSVRATSGCSAL
ncbi:hypothetical protein S245_019590 [Arachis hypogaea]